VAILNAESNQIVIRLVYDGLALSGKTTSLKMLAGSLDQELYTPEEKYGRTVFFDWLGYTGGLFEGYQIRCQIVSVPGQEPWAPRRQRLIESADVIVFVGDTTLGRFADSIASLKRLHQHLQSASGPPVGIIFQANKRDMADVVSMHEIRRELGEAVKDVAIVESVASEGSGVRQAFVFGVRLCLDRVREMIRTGTLPAGVPEIDSGEALLRELRAAEELGIVPAEESQPCSAELATGATASGEGHSQLVDDALEEVFMSEDRIVAADNRDEDDILDLLMPAHCEQGSALGHTAPPALPNAHVPSGMIWPPVEGRIILTQATASSPAVCQADSGDWTAFPQEEWKFYSYAGDVFYDLQAARKTLINWAHRHIALMPIVSPTRALVLAETGLGDWRLWQVVRVESSLLSLSREALRSTNPQQIADAVWGTAYMYLTAEEQFRALHAKLPFSLDNIGLLDGTIRYNGLIPTPASFELGQDRIEDNGFVHNTEGVLRAQIKAQIKAMTPGRITGGGVPIDTVIDAISRRGDGSIRSRQAFEITSDLLREIIGPE